MTDHRVRVWREPDGSWSAQGVDVPEAITTGDSLAETERHMKEALAVALDLPRSAERELRLEFEISVDGGSIDRLAREAREARVAAATAAATMKRAVAELRGKGLSTRDIARLTGITPGRVSQILSEISHAA